MAFKFSARSKNFLLFVHPDLVAVANRALQLSTVDFAITEGMRTPGRQADLYKAGLSKTLNSRHLHGLAIDIAAYRGDKLVWDWQPYEDISVAFKAASKELDIPIDWGGDFPTFKDGVHYQLTHAAYPDTALRTTGV